MMNRVVGLRTSLLLLILPCICLIFFLSIFAMQVDNAVSYRGIAIQPSPAYSSVYLSNFVSFHTLNDEICRQRFV